MCLCGHIITLNSPHCTRLKSNVINHMSVFHNAWKNNIIMDFITFQIRIMYIIIIRVGGWIDKQKNWCIGLTLLVIYCPSHTAQTLSELPRPNKVDVHIILCTWLFLLPLHLFKFLVRWAGMQNVNYLQRPQGHLASESIREIQRKPPPQNTGKTGSIFYTCFITQIPIWHIF